MMRILVIDEQVRCDVERLVDYAKQRENWYNARDRSAGWMERLPGHNEKLNYKIHDGYRCVFSYTFDSKQKTVYRHLSISVSGEHYPSPEAVLMIGNLFGFTGEVTNEDRKFPDSWGIELNTGGVIDDHCIVVAQETDLVP